MDRRERRAPHNLAVSIPRWERPDPELWNLEMTQRGPANKDAARAPKALGLLFIGLWAVVGLVSWHFNYRPVLIFALCMFVAQVLAVSAHAAAESLCKLAPIRVDWTIRTFYVVELSLWFVGMWFLFRA